MDRAPTFLDLLGTHAELDELFLLHQEAILEGDGPLALSRLSAFESDLRKHIAAEEELLIPLYSQRVERVRGAPPEFFTGEHQRMLEALARTSAAISPLCAAPLGKRDILRLLDQQYMFKHMSEHHNLREEKFLYPLLDATTEAKEREYLLLRCFASLPLRQPR